MFCSAVYEANVAAQKRLEEQISRMLNPKIDVEKAEAQDMVSDNSVVLAGFCFSRMIIPTNCSIIISLSFMYRDMPLAQKAGSHIN